jgi:hypothetical protein
MKNNNPKSDEEHINEWEIRPIVGDPLTPFEKAIIEQSLREIEAGLVVPHEEVMKQAAQWIKEKK